MHESETNQRNESTFETLNDGAPLVVTFRTGCLDPDHRDIKVQKVAVRNMTKLANAWGKEAQEVAVYSGLSEDEVDMLTDESFEEIIERGRRLNQGPFARWFNRQAAALKAIGKDINLLTPSPLTNSR